MRITIDINKKGENIETVVSSEEDSSTEDIIMYLLFSLKTVSTNNNFGDKRLALMMAKTLKMSMLPNKGIVIKDMGIEA